MFRSLLEDGGPRWRHPTRLRADLHVPTFCFALRGMPPGLALACMGFNDAQGRVVGLELDRNGMAVDIVPDLIPVISHIVPCTQFVEIARDQGRELLACMPPIGSACPRFYAACAIQPSLAKRPLLSPIRRG
jgi:hypothetical protein